MKGSVLLGISGGIAAYKAPFLVRLFAQADMDVHVVMTRAAGQFVTPMTLATLSGNRVHDDMWDAPRTPSVEHISLADSADVAVIAPATADIIGKMAAGIADDMLTTVLLAVTCPVLVCPSMNVNMYRNPVVQRNLSRLRDLGYHVLAPESGYLACGWTGDGRLPDPEVIVDETLNLIAERDLEGERILVTAGPTEELLDPVRFLTNRSSGKMGVAVAARAAARGASVTLVAGPLKVPPPTGIRLINVRTAREMKDRVTEAFPEVDAVVKAAAVADFRPSRPSPEKVKKQDMDSSMTLVKNPDILKGLAKIKRKDQILVGFAAETQDVLKNGRVKLKKKNLDMLVLNDVSKAGAGFDHDTNIVRFLHCSGEEEQMEIMSKEKVADLILDRILVMRKKATDHGGE